jgi:hypothetical protein
MYLFNCKKGSKDTKKTIKYFDVLQRYYFSVEKQRNN